jgi:2-polyprenyl-6-hydroxyphenyl methylase/3-demethylubiquinone-9 3-methyltransferase
MPQESADRSVAAVAPVIPQTAYPSAEPSWPNRYIWPVLLRILDENPAAGSAVFEIGSGNGATADMLARRGYRVIGIDPAIEGVEIARRNFPQAAFHLGTAYDDLTGTYGTFPIVISLEVIEHCYSIKAYLETVFRLIEPGGLGIISTPFHGYWKNLALSLAGKWDSHHDPLWEGGHIKFFSEKTLAQALQNAGFVNIGFRRAGRIKVVAKSTIAVFRRPA